MGSFSPGGRRQVRISARSEAWTADVSERTGAEGAVSVWVLVSAPSFPSQRVPSSCITRGVRPRIGRDLAPRCNIDIIPARDPAHNFLISPRTGGAAVAVSVGGDIDDECAVIHLQGVGEEGVEHLHELRGGAAEPHGVGQIVDFHVERHGDNLAVVELLDIGASVSSTSPCQS